MLAASFICAGGIIATGLSTALLVRAARMAGRRSRAQSGMAPLEFALAFPFLLMSVLVTIQTALLIDAYSIVDHAAYAAARSASVWIPESVGAEDTNALGRNDASSEKWARIRRAATIACLPIAARFTQVNFGVGSILPASLGGTVDFDALVAASGLFGTPPPPNMLTVAGVLADRWAYAETFTDVSIAGADDAGQARFENGGHVTVTVTHRYAMDVPFAGPALGRLLGRRYFRFFGGFEVPVSSSYTVRLWDAREAQAE